MKKKFLEGQTKKQLREIVAKVITISDTKLNKMSRIKCYDRLKDLSYSQLLELSK
ncbi:MAG: hypothetical protein IMY67_11230 [Bacteroidetes bacterium]|nr:hypothetical protein [Bacteroidota bacterium]